MDFTLTAEQTLLRDALAGFLADRHDIATSRTALGSDAGHRPELWRAFADELGILGAALPESVGGSGGGPVETMVIAEELGRARVLEPYVESVVLGGGVLRRVDAAPLLTALASGGARIAPALLEPGSGHTAHDVTMTARRDGGDWVLDGAKAVVVGAPHATHLLLSARTAGDRRDEDGISLFAVPFDAAAPPAGMRVHPYRTIDDRHAADLELDGVRLPPDALLGDEGQGWTVLSPALDEAVAAVCAEAVGSLRTVLADTVAYTKERRQFGQPIGSFQALQHRMVDMYLELEQAVSATYLATLRLEAPPAERARAVSAAKVTVARAARFVGQNAVQLHGGMGMTQELAIGHHFTRLTVVEREFGTADDHRSRYARLSPAPGGADS
ncbi:acyl-CoA dehydrogenase family protein [Pseudonocardia sp. ICBG601]|uniref:acyl-CoA dehydrogenase family protein n=1 Tax=Pseudonocardia sp. ICBG601 TaxID=2846759 RepID=UPI001CF69BF1|nr:acyl-CoA dehydrogenase [Pseudonocardia sp. ICBG601]